MWKADDVNYCYYHHHHHHHHQLFIIDFFSSGTLLKQCCTPSLRLQVSDCTTSLIMYNALSTAVFCVGSIERFHGIVYRFVLVF